MDLESRGSAGERGEENFTCSSEDLGLQSCYQGPSIERNVVHGFLGWPNSEMLSIVHFVSNETSGSFGRPKFEILTSG